MSGSTEFEVPETGAVEETPQLNPRNEIMARAAARRIEQIAADNAQAATFDREATEAGLNFAQDDPVPETDPEPAPQAVPPQPVQPEQAAPSAPSPVAAPAPQVRFVEVDGQQFAVTPDQERELLRMGVMANTALHQYQYREQTQVPAVPEPPRPVVDQDLVRDTVNKLQYSSPDEAAAALTELISGVVSRVPQAPQIDQNAIVSRAVAEARAQAQLASDQAIIQQEYADLFEHPQRTFLAQTNVNAIRNRNIQIGRQQAEIDIYREAGDMVREAMNLSRPGTDTTNSPALQSTPGNVVPIRQDVIERKRAAPSPTRSIDLRAQAPAAARAKSPSDIVDDMRKARGLASMR